MLVSDGRSLCSRLKTTLMVEVICDCNKYLKYFQQLVREIGVHPQYPWGYLFMRKRLNLLNIWLNNTLNQISSPDYVFHQSVFLSASCISVHLLYWFWPFNSIFVLLNIRSLLKTVFLNSLDTLMSKSKRRVTFFQMTLHKGVMHLLLHPTVL